jgi:hypothetical protein
MSQQNISQTDFISMCSKFRSENNCSIVSYFIDCDNVFELSDKTLEEYNKYLEECLFKKLLNDKTITIETVMKSLSHK